MEPVEVPQADGEPLILAVQPSERRLPGQAVPVFAGMEQVRDAGGPRPPAHRHDHRRRRPDWNREPPNPVRRSKKDPLILELRLERWYSCSQDPFPPFLPNERWFMPPAPPTAPDPDAPEPSSSGSGSGSGSAGPGQRPVPADGDDGAPEPSWSDEEDGADYLGELMAAAAAGEDLTAQDIAGAGFGEDGTAHQLRPGPVLATLVHAATTDEKILATLSDDDLAGVITAVRRIGSFAAWAELTAIREYATRPGTRRPGPGPAPDAGPGSRGRARGLDSRDPDAAVAGPAPR